MEALYGVYIPQREYHETEGRIPIVPDAAGNNFIEVKKLRKHPHPLGERVRWQVCEGGVIQNAGRARIGLRGPGEPCDLHLWTDLPVPELGPVIPVLWDEVNPGIEGLMLASCSRGQGLRGAAHDRRHQAGPKRGWRGQ